MHVAASIQRLDARVREALAETKLPSVETGASSTPTIRSGNEHLIRFKQRDDLKRVTPPGITAAVLLPPQSIVLGLTTGALIAINLVSGEIEASVRSAHRGPVTALVLDVPSGEAFASSSKDGSWKVWATPVSDLMTPIMTQTHRHPIMAVALQPNFSTTPSGVVAAGDTLGSVMVQCRTQMMPDPRVLYEGKGPVTQAIFHPSLPILVWADDDGHRVANVRTGQRIAYVRGIPQRSRNTEDEVNFVRPCAIWVQFDVICLSWGDTLTFARIIMLPKGRPAAPTKYALEVFKYVSINENVTGLGLMCLCDDERCQITPARDALQSGADERDILYQPFVLATAVPMSSTSDARSSSSQAPSHSPAPDFPHSPAPDFPHSNPALRVHLYDAAGQCASSETVGCGNWQIQHSVNAITVHEQYALTELFQKFDSPKASGIPIAATQSAESCCFIVTDRGIVQVAPLDEETRLVRLIAVGAYHAALQRCQHRRVLKLSVGRICLSRLLADGSVRGALTLAAAALDYQADADGAQVAVEAFHEAGHIADLVAELPSPATVDKMKDTRQKRAFLSVLEDALAKVATVDLNCLHSILTLDSWWVVPSLNFDPLVAALQSLKQSVSDKDKNVYLHCLSILLERRGLYKDALDLLFHTSDSTAIFSFLARNYQREANELKEPVLDALSLLFKLNTPAATAFLTAGIPLEHSLQVLPSSGGTFQPEEVVTSLHNSPDTKGSLLAYLESLFEHAPLLCRPYIHLMVSLAAEAAPSRLLELLQRLHSWTNRMSLGDEFAPSYYLATVNKQLQVMSKHSEVLHDNRQLLQVARRMGLLAAKMYLLCLLEQKEEALRILIQDLKDPVAAYNLVAHSQSPKLWDIFVTNLMASPSDLEVVVSQLQESQLRYAVVDKAGSLAYPLEKTDAVPLAPVQLIEGLSHAKLSVMPNIDTKVAKLLESAAGAGTFVTALVQTTLSDYELLGRLFASHREAGIPLDPLQPLTPLQLRLVSEVGKNKTPTTAPNRYAASTAALAARTPLTLPQAPSALDSLVTPLEQLLQYLHTRREDASAASNTIRPPAEHMLGTGWLGFLAAAAMQLPEIAPDASHPPSGLVCAVTHAKCYHCARMADSSRVPFAVFGCGHVAHMSCERNTCGRDVECRLCSQWLMRADR